MAFDLVSMKSFQLFLQLCNKHIKIKRNKKKEGQCRLSEVNASNKHLSKQKMRTTLWQKKFILLFAFFAESVSLLIPSFFYFVNPFCVMSTRLLIFNSGFLHPELNAVRENT